MVSGFQYSSAAGDVRVAHSLRLPIVQLLGFLVFCVLLLLGPSLATLEAQIAASCSQDGDTLVDENLCTAREDPWGESHTRSIELKYQCTLVMSQYLSP